MARLSIPDQDSFREFTVTTPTSVFPIPFSLFAKADLTVLVDGVDVGGAGFTFSGAILDGGGYAGGTVTLNTAVDDCVVRIERNVAPVRTSQFAPAASVPVGAVDQAINRLTATQQDIKRSKVERPFGREGKFLAFDASGNEVASSGTGSDGALREDLVEPTGAALVGHRLPEGVGLRTQTLAEFAQGGAVQPSQFSGTAAERFTRAIAEAATSRNGGLGQTVQLPRGRLDIDAPFNASDRVSVIGVNKRGSVIAPSAGFVGSYLATAERGALSMFDNALERLTLDCDHKAGLGGVVSDAFQEGGGLNKVLIEKFTTEGIRLRSGFGGAALTMINDTEIMGSNQIKATTGIYFEQMGLIGKFVLNVTNSTIAGSPLKEVSPGVPEAGPIDKWWLSNGIHVENDSLLCTAVHFEQCTTGIYLDGIGHHVLVGLTGLDTVTNLVEIASTFTGTFVMIGCQRAGATNLLKDNRAGGLGTIAYDIRRIESGSTPALALGANAAGGTFDGGSSTPATTTCFGVSGIVRNSTGDYTITLSRPGTSAYSFAVVASSKTQGGSVDSNLVGNSTVNIVNRGPANGGVAGSPTNSNEIHFLVTRVA